MTRISSFGEKKLTIFDQLIFFLRYRSIKNYLHDCSRLVDLGCGYEARFLQWATRTFHIQKPIGIDLSISHTTHTATPISFKKADLNKDLPLREKSVDIVTSLAVLEHLECPEKNLTEIYRILKPSSGMLLLTTPAPLAKPLLEALASLRVIDADEIRDHKNYFTGRELRTMLRKAGFEDAKIHTTTFLGGLNNLVVCYR